MRPVGVIDAAEAAFRARVRQLLGENYIYSDEWLADGHWMFEDWYEKIC